MRCPGAPAAELEAALIKTAGGESRAAIGFVLQIAVEQGTQLAW